MAMVKPVTIITALLLFVTFCAAQQINIDSLKKILPSLHDSARVDCLNSITEGYIGLPEWFNEIPAKAKLDTAQRFNQLALAEAKKQLYIYGMARATALRAELVFDTSNYPEAENLATAAIALYRQTPNKRRLNRTYWLLGATLHAQSTFDAALHCVDTCLAKPAVR